MATINGTNFNDNNTNNGGAFRPSLVGVVDPGFILVGGLPVFTFDLPDTINGLLGNDILTGLGTNDTLNGGDGNDIIDGGAGVDSMVGGAGDDTYYVDNSSDAITEAVGAGTETVYSSATYSFNAVAKAGLNHLTLTGVAAINGTGNALGNTINGNSANNLLSGLSGSDTLNGLAGNDTIYGGTENDTIDGGTGNDTLRGDAGSDNITSGTGADIIVFNSLIGSDTVTDYSVASDSIQLSKAAFTTLGPIGALTAAEFKSGGAGIQLNANLDATDRIIYDTVNDNLYYDADGSGLGANAILVGHFTNNPTLVVGEFSIVA